jgi:hypothetical protein
MRAPDAGTPQREPATTIGEMPAVFFVAAPAALAGLSFAHLILIRTTSIVLLPASIT